MNEQRRLCTALVVFVLLFHSVPGFAEQACPEGDSPERMRENAAEAFAEGQQFYNAGDHGAALERFQCSFRLVPHPNTLFNIGETAELAGDLSQALRSFRQYLVPAPE